MGRGPAKAVAIAALAGVMVGASLFAQQAPAPTLQELEAAARRDSLDPETLYRLALRYDIVKRYDDAGRMARQVVMIDPRYAPAWLLLGYIPYDRRPKLWDEVRKDKVPAAWRDSVVESQRLFRRALLIDPLVDFRVMGAPPPHQDMVAIPDYGDYTTGLLADLGDLLRDAGRLTEAAEAFRRAQQRLAALPQ